MKFILFSFTFLMSLKAFSYCAINLKGDDICPGQKALLKTTIEDVFEIVKIRYITSHNKVSVSAADGRLLVNPEKLIGTDECDGTICPKSRVNVDHDCAQNIGRDSVTVQTLYSNGLVEVKEGFFSKSQLVDINCLR